MIFGLDDSWHETDQGQFVIYNETPNSISVDRAARVIYELRQDIAELNRQLAEAIILVPTPHERLLAANAIDTDIAVLGEQARLRGIPANCSIELINDYREYVVGHSFGERTLRFREWITKPLLCDQELLANARREGFLNTDEERL